MDRYLLALDLTSAKAWLVIGSACGTFLAVVGVLALVWAFMKPWLISQLVEPLHETRDASRQTQHQVTVNGHSSETPTVLDLLSELRTGQQEIRDDFAAHVRRGQRRDGVVDRRMDAFDRQLGDLRADISDQDDDPRPERSQTP